MENNTFVCAYCDKEYSKSEGTNIINLGGRVCKICSELFGIHVLSVEINEEKSDEQTIC